MSKNIKNQTFAEHIRELRLRLMFVVAVILAGCGVGYAYHDQLFNFLKKPLGQQLYYTTPVGGFNAMLKISVLVGLIASVPFLIYQLCQFISPAFKNLDPKRPLRILMYSTTLAIAGAAFGYYVSLPASLKFLTNIDSGNVQPLIVVGDYLNFVFSYLLGFAVLFQLPLIMLLINKIKPQKPSGLMRYQRWIILISFIIAALLTPTPDPINQFIMAAPVILLYQFSIITIWFQNRKKTKPVRITESLNLVTQSEVRLVPVSTSVSIKVKMLQSTDRIVVNTVRSMRFMDIIPPSNVTSSFSRRLIST